MEVKDLESKRELLSLEIKSTAKQIDHLLRLLLPLKEKLIDLTAEYNSVDREMAMVDGRLKIITRGRRTDDKDKKIVITKEQAKEIAKLLGIKLGGI